MGPCYTSLKTVARNMYLRHEMVSELHTHIMLHTSTMLGIKLLQSTSCNTKDGSRNKQNCVPQTKHVNSA